MYNDVRAHIQEMLDICAIHKPHSPWTSAAVLVLKKDSHWCIIYLDDTVIFSKELASHLERLEAVFWKLEK